MVAKAAIWGRLWNCRAHNVREQVLHEKLKFLVKKFWCLSKQELSHLVDFCLICSSLSFFLFLLVVFFVGVYNVNLQVLSVGRSATFFQHSLLLFCTFILSSCCLLLLGAFVFSYLVSFFYFIFRKTLCCIPYSGYLAYMLRLCDHESHWPLNFCWVVMLLYQILFIFII